MGENLVAKDSVLKLRYLGVLPQVGHREYGFRIENKEKEIRKVIVTIDDTYFLKNQLRFQEAPDLCYQRILMDIDNESADATIAGTSMVPITPTDIARYRDSRPTAKTRQHR
jgi:hypothetical protein